MSLASNVSCTDQGLGKVIVRSLSPCFANLVYAKRNGALIQLDFYAVDVESIPIGETDDEPGAITLNEKNMLPHTTLLLSLETAQNLLDQIQPLLSNPEDPTDNYKKGLFYRSVFQLELSTDQFKKALQKQPSFYEAYKQLAINYDIKGEMTLALEAYAGVAGKDDAQKINMATLMPMLFESMDDVHVWRNRFQEEVQKLNSQPLHLDNIFEMGPAYYKLAYHGLDNKTLNEDYSRLFSKFQFFKAVSKPKHAKPRIGFVSRFLFQEHSIKKVFLGLIEHLARREEFDIVVFGIDPSPAAQSNFPFHAVPLSSAEDILTLCETVRAQEIDILVYTDIGQEPITYFMALNRLAPIQCVTWGHPDTTGLDTMDYYISNRLFEPPNAQASYTEKLLLMDTIPAYYYHPHEANTRLTRADFGFSPKDHLYLCPQSFYKFHPDFDPILGNILRRDPQGILVLINAFFPDWNTLLMDRFQKTIPDVCDRIRILGAMDYDRFLAFLSMGEVILDTLYFGGGSTTYQAFSFGTPIVTQPTHFMRGRMVYGLYQKMQIHDCIAHSAEEYVEIAVRLGTDPDYRESVKAKIQTANHLLYEDTAAVEEFGALLSKLLQSGGSND
jgi:protein O-GlcNAc transferase